MELYILPISREWICNAKRWIQDTAHGYMEAIRTKWIKQGPGPHAVHRMLNSRRDPLEGGQEHGEPRASHIIAACYSLFRNTQHPLCNRQPKDTRIPPANVGSLCPKHWDVTLELSVRLREKTPCDPHSHPALKLKCAVLQVRSQI